jgi:hypothetical protein
MADPVTIGVGALLIGGTIAQQQKAMKAQKAGLELQRQAQDQAESAAIAQQRRADMAYNAANKKTPDVQGILLGEQQAAKGIGSTMLTGPGGIDKSKLVLGGGTLLGG